MSNPKFNIFDHQKELGHAVINTMLGLYNEAVKTGCLGYSALEEWTFYVPKILWQYADDYKMVRLAELNCARVLSKFNEFQGVPVVNGYEQVLVLAHKDAALHPELVFKNAINNLEFKRA